MSAEVGVEVFRHYRAEHKRLSPAHLISHMDFTHHHNHTTSNMLLTDKVTIPDTANDPEDYLYSSLGTIFTDDASVQHGDPGSTVIYTSARFGDIKLSLADPTGESERKLFAHFLWNAGIWIAEAISAEGDDANGAGGGSAEGGWNVKGERCIELGAGTYNFHRHRSECTTLIPSIGLGLGGIVSCLCGAEEVSSAPQACLPSLPYPN